MPGKGYSTIGLKPGILSRLEHLTHIFYPGMFLPSTLIMLMNEVKLERYSVATHRMAIDLTGKYSSLTIRSDVRTWLEENHKKLESEYKETYRSRCFAHFTSYFLANLFESKFTSRKNVIGLNESDFEWLQKEYLRRRKESGSSTELATFGRFADQYINDLLQRVKAAKEILSV